MFHERPVADLRAGDFADIADFNFIADGNLKADEELLKKLTDSAKTDQEKYHLARALEEVIAPEISPLQNQTETQEPAPIQSQDSAQPQPQPQEIKKPYLPFANYKPPVATPSDSQPQSGQNPLNGQPQGAETQSQPINGQSPTPTQSEPSLRPVPPRPQVRLAQEIS